MRFLISSLLSLFVLLSSNTFALSEEAFGVVDIYSYGRPHIVIDDTRYRMALNVAVFDVEGKKAVRTVIKPGVKVLYRANWRDGLGTVQELRLLPQDAQRSSFERESEGG